VDIGGRGEGRAERFFIIIIIIVVFYTIDDLFLCVFWFICLGGLWAMEQVVGGGIMALGFPRVRNEPMRAAGCNASARQA
jgi:hypothetical protein